MDPRFNNFAIGNGHCWLITISNAEISLDCNQL
jgi:hypothetical protein